MKCSVCGKEKEQTGFYFRKDRREYRLDCKDCCKKRALACYEKNPQKTIEQSRVWAKENKEKHNERRREWCKRNIEKRHITTKNHYESHKKERSAYTKQWLKNKRATDISYRIKHSVSSAITACLRSGKDRKTWESLLGYGITELKRNLEKQFIDGMNWNNYGSDWHIDHKTPISAFNINSYDDYDFKRCWGIKNLQPLLKIDNLQKHDKLERPFQPSLL